MKTSVPWVLLLAACSGLAEPARSPFGFLQVVTRAQDGVPTSYPRATFLNAQQSSFPDSRDTTNVCSLGDLATSVPSVVDNLDAGDSVAFTGDGGTVYLVPTPDLLGNISYQPRGASVPLTSGTEVMFQIPGASGGFPQADVNGLTPPPLTEVSPIPTSVAGGDSMVVTWGPVGDDSSRIEIMLAYGAAGAPTVNRQVLCQWRDDGRGVISGGLLGDWSRASLRQVQVTRFRTARQVLPSGPVLYFFATYDTLPPLP